MNSCYDKRGETAFMFKRDPKAPTLEQGALITPGMYPISGKAITSPGYTNKYFMGYIVACFVWLVVSVLQLNGKSFFFYFGFCYISFIFLLSFSLLLPPSFSLPLFPFTFTISFSLFASLSFLLSLFHSLCLCLYLCHSLSHFLSHAFFPSVPNFC